MAAMDCHVFFSAEQRDLCSGYNSNSEDLMTGSAFQIPGLTFRKKPHFEENLPTLQDWVQKVQLLGQSNAGESSFLKKLLNTVRPEQLVVISNTSAKQYRQDGMTLKH